MKIKTKNILLFTLFSLSLLIFLLLSSYKLTLLLTPLSMEQKNAFQFLENKGNLNSNYTAAEVSHLQDVKKLMQGVNYSWYLSFLILMGIVIYYYKKDKRILPQLFFAGGLTSLIVILFFVLSVFASFNLTFTLFHRLFFPQCNWIFPANSLIIQTFPLDFFVDLSTEIILLALILSISILVISPKRSKI